MSDYIDDRLKDWAKWAISGRPHLGLSDHTLIYEMVRSGVIAKGQGLKPEPEARQEEETESALMWLKDKEPKQYEVVVTHYIGRGTVKQKAKDVNLGEATYFNFLKLAKYRLEAWLEARISFT